MTLLIRSLVLLCSINPRVICIGRTVSNSNHLWLFHCFFYRHHQSFHFFRRLCRIQKAKRHAVVPFYRYDLHKRMDTLPILDSKQNVITVLTAVKHFYIIKIEIHHIYLGIILLQIVSEAVYILTPSPLITKRFSPYKSFKVSFSFPASL